MREGWGFGSHSDNTSHILHFVSFNDEQVWIVQILLHSYHFLDMMDKEL